MSNELLGEMTALSYRVMLWFHSSLDSIELLGTKHEHVFTRVVCDIYFPFVYLIVVDYHFISAFYHILVDSYLSYSFVLGEDTHTSTCTDPISCFLVEEL